MGGLHDFCELLGLGPMSTSWAEVMSMCGAASILCGQRHQAQETTEKLLANSHTGAWRLAVALSTDGLGHCGGPLDPNHASDLLADALKICPAGEMPQLLGCFRQGLAGPTEDTRASDWGPLFSFCGLESASLFQ